MNCMTRCVAGLGVACMMGLPGVVVAQDEPDRLGSFKYWSAFTTQNSDGKVCWAATAPVDADYSGSSRSDVFLMVSVYPASDVDGEVSIISGYTYDDDKTVQAKIGSQTYTFFVDGDGAWLETRPEDSRVITAMRRGAKASVTGYSADGGRSTDSFSLLGFTAAYNAAKKACG